MDGERASTFLTTETRNALLIDAVTEITARYYEQAADLVSLVSSDLRNGSFILVFNLKRLFFSLMSMSRLGKQIRHSRKSGREYKDELEQAQMFQTITSLTLTRFACNSFLIFRYHCFDCICLLGQNGEASVGFYTYSAAAVIFVINTMPAMEPYKMWLTYL